ncbi:MAG: universal stress protein [Bdellovibrionaceae bacterium]|nr:universal stress protein [Pseudobdellovibrionaceae bacterium]
MLETPSRVIQLCGQIRKLQGSGIFRSIEAISVIHPDLYLYPSSWYRSMKRDLYRRTKAILGAILNRELGMSRLHVFSLPQRGPDDLIEMFSGQAEQHGSDVLIVSHTRRNLLFNCLFGNVSEKAVMRSRVPVLILKPDHDLEVRGEKPSILLAVDPLHPPANDAFDHVLKMAKFLSAEIKIVSVRPRAGLFSKPIPRAGDGSGISRIKDRLVESGVKVSVEMIDETANVARELEKYASTHGATLIATGAPRRGHTVRGLLRVSRRPVFVLRADEFSKNNGESR